MRWIIKNIKASVNDITRYLHFERRQDIIMKKMENVNFDNIENYDIINWKWDEKNNKARVSIEALIILDIGDVK